MVVDEDFFVDLVGEPDDFSVDIGLTDYWKNYFQTALNEENAKRKKQGLDILREAPGEGEVVGREVTFLQ